MKILSIFLAINSASIILCIQLDLQGLINNATTSLSPVLTLPSGTFTVASPVYIMATHGLTIRGSGTKLIFNPSESKLFDIFITNSNNLVLQDIEIDNDPLPFTQGRVTLINTTSNYFDLAIHTGYSTNASRFGDTSYAHDYNSTTRRFKQEGDLIYTSSAQNIAGGLRFYLKSGTTISYANLQVNDLVAVAQPGFVCELTLYNARNTLIKNVTIYTAPGCGLIEYNGGGTVIDALTIKRGSVPSGATEARLLATTRDGLHLNGPNGGTTIKNCFIEFTGDDAVNIRSEFSTISGITGTTITHNNTNINFDSGAYLHVYDQNNLTLVDTVLVLNHSIGANTAVLQRTNRLSVGNLIVSPQHTQNFVVLNNTFQDVDARGIVASGFNITIESNLIQRTTMPAIWVGAELGKFFFHE